MKRERSDYEESVGHLDIAKCLMLLSQTLTPESIGINRSANDNINLFECKTCNRKFPSFQALGGHRASHKRPKPTADQQHMKPKVTNDHENKNSKQMHECSICGQAFATGQALGGHMRRHRTAAVTEPSVFFPAVPTVPMLKRSNSSKRVVCLDLNLTPLENDLEYIFGKNLAPKVNLKLVI